MKTPKNPLDPRYLKNQRKFFKAINLAIIKRPGIAHQTTEVYTTAKLGRSTFFDHFKNLDYAYLTEKRALKSDFKSGLAKFNKTTPAKSIFRYIVVFVMKHRDFFSATSALHDYHPFATMLELSRPLLSTHWRHYGRHLDKRIYKLFTSQLFPIFEDWAATDFSADSSTTVISQLDSTATTFAAHLSHFVTIAELQTTQNQNQTTNQPRPTAKKEPK